MNEFKRLFVNYLGHPVYLTCVLQNVHSNQKALIINEERKLIYHRNKFRKKLFSIKG